MKQGGRSVYDYGNQKGGCHLITVDYIEGERNRNKYSGSFVVYIAILCSTTQKLPNIFA